MLTAGVATPGRLMVLAGRVVHRTLKLLGRTRHDRPRSLRTNGFQLVVLPQVLDPLLMRTGAYFASQLASTPTRGLRVLDMGTGSGICALAAARHADHVVAVDINPAAVQCCALNAERNRLQDKVTVLQSDLFAALPGQRFDLVMFNPPFLLGAPTDDYDHAWRSVDVASRFAHQLRDHLTDGGFALLLLSTFGDQEIFLGPLRSEGLSCTAYRTKRYFNETVTIYRVAGAP